MFVKDLNIALLLDFYGAVLTERVRKMLDMYYCDDLSLAEISEEFGISRQGVRQAIKKGEEELFSLEEKLGLAARHLAVQEEAEKLLALADRIDQEPSAAALLAKEARSLALAILEENRE